MTLASTSTLRSVRRYLPTGLLQLLLPVLLLAGMLACSSSHPSGTGPQKRLRVAVGEIKEISLSDRPDSTGQVTGTSDNMEVVDVSPKQATSERTTNLPMGNGTFLIKGVTVGKANVIFSKKTPDETGNGQILRTYIVEVVAK